MRIFAVASSKGGVGKTSLAVHLAVGLAREGARTLLVDLDSSGHATTWLNGNMAESGIAEAVMARDLAADMVITAKEEGLYLAPSSAALKGLEAALAGEFGKETILGEVLRAPRRPQFEMVVIDCPPTTGFLTQSAICAATEVISPVLPSFLGLSGVVDIRGLVEQVRRRARPGPRGTKPLFLGCVLFGADEREMVTEDTRAAVRELDAESLFEAEVRISTAGKRLPEDRRTAWEPGADPRGAVDYEAILLEMKRRLAGAASRKAR